MFLDFLKKRKTGEIIILSLVIILAFVVRFWNFGPWLYFENDQSRDANIVKMALLKGPGYLPLLGPRAAGTFLRLGPAEYYFQYLSALIFNSAEPFVLAYPALIFSLLSILVFYFFLKKFFSQAVALMSTAIYAFSFILIQYSRFAWNPNGIPFWGLLFIFSLYKNKTEENRKKAGWWLLLTSLSYGIVSQLHFLALVGFPMVAILFWIFYFPKKIKFYFWVGAISILLLTYLPMFLSEVSTQGDNWQQFKYALTVKTGNEKIDLGEKIKSDLQQTAIAFSMFTTSFGHKDSHLSFYLGSILLVFGFFYAGWLARKNKQKRMLFWLLLSWLGVFLFLYFKTEISLKPRFFFPITAIPFFLLAYGLDFLIEFNCQKKFGYFLAISITLILIGTNLSAVKQWYSFLKNNDAKEISRKMFLKQDSGITLEGLILSSEYMATQAKKNGKNVCYDGIQEYKRAMEYLLEIYYPEIKKERISNGMSIENKKACQFFSFAQKKNKRPKISDRHAKYFKSELAFDGGNLVVWDLTAKEEFYLGNEILLQIEENNFKKDNIEEKKDIESSQEIKNEDDFMREDFLLEETILKDDMSEEIFKKEEEQKIINPPRRKARVFWKDVKWLN